MPASNRHVPMPRPSLPSCERCGIEWELRFTKAHVRCVRAKDRERRAADRTAERRAREYLRARGF
jgi:hypothetical protein